MAIPYLTPIQSGLTRQLITDTKDLIFLYNTNTDFKNQFNALITHPKAIFRRRPLLLYVKVITSFSPKYLPYNKQVVQSKEKIKDLLTEYYQKDFHSFQQAINEGRLDRFAKLLTPEQTGLVEEIEKVPNNSPQQEKLTSQLEEKIKQSPEFKTASKVELTKKEGGKPDSSEKTPEPDKTITVSKTPPSISTTNLRSALSQVKTPKVVKDLTSQGLIAARKLLARYPTAAASVLSGALGSAVGWGVGGPGGAVVGAGVGGSLPAFIKRGGVETISRMGAKKAGQAALGTAGRTAVLTGGRAIAAAVGGGLLSNPLTWAVIGIAIFLLLFIILIPMGLLSSTALLPAYEVTSGGPGSGGYPGGSANLSCAFTRSGKSAPYKSSILMGWINNTAAKTSIPAAILASVARHENPDFTTNADDDHDGIKNNYYYYIDPTGTTRAVGLMQLSTGKTMTPRGLVDHCNNLFDANILKNAAGRLGKKIQSKDYYCVDDVNERVKRFCQTDHVELNKNFYTPPDNKADPAFINLCQITDNLMVGAELLKTKNPSSDWQTEDTVKMAIGGYYGKCDYPGGNYCDEVWQDFKNCQVTGGGQNCTEVTSTAIILDPGHDSNNTEHEGRTEEATFNLAVANKTKQLLESRGVTVKLTHTGTMQDFGPGDEGRYKSLSNRNNLINQAADSETHGFVSIHADSVTLLSGPRAYYNIQRNQSDFSGNNLKLASAVSLAIAQQTDSTTTGIVDSDLNIPPVGSPLYILGPAGVKSDPANPLSVINPATKIPGILNEFFTGGRSYSLLNNVPFVSEIALGYCNGILRYLTNSPQASCSTGTIFTPKKIRVCQIKPVFYSQHDPKWGGLGLPCTVSNTGCGPTTLAMIFTSFGNTITPAAMFLKFYNNGYLNCSQGLLNPAGTFQTLAQQNNYTFVNKSLAYGKNFDITLAADYLNKGYLIIGSYPTRTGISHIFMITAANLSTNQITIYDPNNSGPTSENPNNMYGSNPYSWSYAFPITKN